jgi:hypothetical protein
VLVKKLTAGLDGSIVVVELSNGAILDAYW